MYIYMYIIIIKKIYPPVKAIAPTWEDGRMMMVFLNSVLLSGIPIIYMKHVLNIYQIISTYIHVYIHVRVEVVVI